METEGTTPCEDDKVNELHEKYNTDFGSSHLSSDDNCKSTVISDSKTIKPLKWKATMVTVETVILANFSSVTIYQN